MCTGTLDSLADVIMSEQWSMADASDNLSPSTNPMTSISHKYGRLVEHLKDETILETFRFIDKGFDVSYNSVYCKILSNVVFCLGVACCYPPFFDLPLLKWHPSDLFYLLAVHIVGQPKFFDIFSPEGGCSEGLDAFRFFLNKYK